MLVTPVTHQQYKKVDVNAFCYLSSQKSESIHINKLQHSINNCTEWNHLHIPQLTIRRGAGSEDVLKSMILRTQHPRPKLKTVKFIRPKLITQAQENGSNVKTPKTIAFPNIGHLGVHF